MAAPSDGPVCATVPETEVTEKLMNWVLDSTCLSSDTLERFENTGNLVGVNLRHVDAIGNQVEYMVMN